MATRRRFLAWVGGLAGGVVLAGCDAGPDGVPDLLLVDSAAGLALVRGIGARLLGTGLATPVGDEVYTTGPEGGDTVLARVAAATGEPTGRVLLAGRWVPGAVSADGQRLALTAPDGGEPRERTSILVADAGGDRWLLDLPGDLRPDAFARAGTALFVVDRLHEPERHRVRLVDLAAGTFVETLTRDEVPVPLGAEEQMYATVRRTVLAPDGDVQYTLYLQDPGPKIPGESGAYVYTLDLAAGRVGWLDLPEPFGRGPAQALTIAVTSDGRRVVVADLSGGHLVIADAATLALAHVLEIRAGGGTAYAVTPPGSRLLYLGLDTDVTVVDLDVLTTVAHWPAGVPVRGLAVSRDGTRLLIGYPGGIAWLDSGDGRPRGRVPVPGLTELLRAL